MAILMYDNENFELKFLSLRATLKEVHFTFLWKKMAEENKLYVCFSSYSMTDKFHPNVSALQVHFLTIQLVQLFSYCAFV